MIAAPLHLMAVCLAWSCPKQPVGLSSFGDVVRLQATPAGHLLVQADANGTPIWLVVDTGATGSYLTRQAATRLKLKVMSEGKDVIVADGRRASSLYHFLPRLTIGRCTSYRLSIGAADLDLVGRVAADLGIVVDGVLGADILRRFNAVIDYHDRTMRLDPIWADHLTAMQGDWAATAFEDDGNPLDYLKRDNFRGIRLKVRGDLMTLDLGAVNLSSL